MENLSSSSINETNTIEQLPEIKIERKGNPAFSKDHPGYVKPKGVEKGTVSITREIKAMLLKVPQNKKKTYLQLIVQHILTKAAIKHDYKMLKLVWNYIDGLPKQQLVGGEADDLPVVLKVIREMTIEEMSIKKITIFDGNGTGNQDVSKAV